AVLLLAGSPFLDLHMANSDVAQLPASAESRAGSALLEAQFPQAGQNTVDVVMRTNRGTPVDADSVASAYALSRRLRAVPGVVGVRSYVDVDPSLSATTYGQLYAQPREQLPANLRSVLTELTGTSIAVLQVQTSYPTQ